MITPTSASRHFVCSEEELPPGARKIVKIAGRSLGVFNVGGRIYALKNVCPHKYAPLCEGPLTGLVAGERPGSLDLERNGEIIRCPWHGWEFDLCTGRSVFDPRGVRTKTYPACFESGVGNVGVDSPVPASVETFPVGIEARQVVVFL